MIFDSGKCCIVKFRTNKKCTGRFKDMKEKTTTHSNIDTSSLVQYRMKPIANYVCEDVTTRF